MERTQEISEWKSAYKKFIIIQSLLLLIAGTALIALPIMILTSALLTGAGYWFTTYRVCKARGTWILFISKWTSPILMFILAIATLFTPVSALILLYEGNYPFAACYTLLALLYFQLIKATRDYWDKSKILYTANQAHRNSHTIKT